MKRWVVRLTAGPDVTVRADDVQHAWGVLLFHRVVQDPATAGHQNRFPDRLELVRAFGVGQWRDVEPLADPPEPDPEAGVIRAPVDRLGCRDCGHRRHEHVDLRSCQVHHCVCMKFE